MKAPVLPLSPFTGRGRFACEPGEGLYPETPDLDVFGFYGLPLTLALSPHAGRGDYDYAPL